MNGLKELAIEAGMHYREIEDQFCEADTDGVPFEMLERFVKLAVRREANKVASQIIGAAVAAEREACAWMCDLLADDYGKAGLPMTHNALRATARHIRARGQQ